MTMTLNRRAMLQSGAAALLAGAAPLSALAASLPAKPEAGAIKMGIEPSAALA